MPRVSLLPIDDGIVSPHLQLLRQVCEPSSTSRPHVTVRYFERLRVPEEYGLIQVTHIDLIEPGMFAPKAKDLHHPGGGGNQTVFIRCKSDDLARLEHKPHFPGSDFHITIYDGTSKAFARSVLSELQRFKWGIRVPLSGKIGLTVRELKPTNRRATRPEPASDPILKELFWSIAGQDLSRSYLISLQNHERLELCRAVLKSLFRAARHLERVSSTRTKFREAPPGGSAAPNLPAVHLTPPELARRNCRLYAWSN